MLKNILNLEGTQKLSSAEQKEINGGIPAPLCGDGGSWSDINSCLCKGGGTYNKTTQTCSNNQPSGKYFENATSCCYDFSDL